MLLCKCCGELPKGFSHYGVCKKTGRSERLYYWECGCEAVVSVYKFVWIKECKRVVLDRCRKVLKKIRCSPSYDHSNVIWIGYEINKLIEDIEEGLG
jgi:hypothetical protein